MRIPAAGSREYRPMLQLQSTYSLTETARLLAMDVKTLRAKLRLFGITPARSTNDARAWLLTREQIDTLVRRLSDAENEASISTRLARATAGSEEQRIVGFEASQHEFAQSVNRLSEIVERLNQELSSRLDQLIEFEQGRQNDVVPAAVQYGHQPQRRVTGNLNHAGDKLGR